MECPYCHNQLRDGYIFSDRAIYTMWLPAGEKPPILLINVRKTIQKKKGFVLHHNEGPFLEDQDSLKAQFCPHCKKVIIDVQTEERILK